MQAIASGSGTPQLSEVRFSSRRAAKVTTYNEDEGFDFSEEDTENMTPNYYYAEEDTRPSIDQVLNHRLLEGVGPFMITLQFYLDNANNSHQNLKLPTSTSMSSS